MLGIEAARLWLKTVNTGENLLREEVIRDGDGVIRIFFWAAQPRGRQELTSRAQPRTGPRTDVANYTPAGGCAVKRILIRREVAGESSGNSRGVNTPQVPRRGGR